MYMHVYVSIKNLKKGKFGLSIMVMKKCFVTEQNFLGAFHHASRAKNLF